MALFGSGNKVVEEEIRKKLSVHPLLRLVAIIMSGEENGEEKELLWRHCITDYGDSGIRTVYIMQDGIGLVKGKICHEIWTEQDFSEGILMRYTCSEYEPISNYKGISYKRIMQLWAEAVKGYMRESYPDYTYSTCSTYETGLTKNLGEYSTDDSQCWYFTYTLPRPAYKKWFEE